MQINRWEMHFSKSALGANRKEPRFFEVHTARQLPANPCLLPVPITAGSFSRLWLVAPDHNNTTEALLRNISIGDIVLKRLIYLPFADIWRATIGALLVWNAIIC